MHPILFSIGNFYVGSYAAMVFVAVLTAILTTIVRARRGALDSSLLARALIVALICGWVISRASLLSDPNTRSLGWRVFLPTQGGGGSLTYFGVGAAVGLIVFLVVSRQPVLVVADAIAPSILLAVGIAKVGCLLSGCCEGAVCSSPFGITYPYGSVVHEKHLAQGLVAAPDDLLGSAPGPTHTRRALGHLQALQYEAATAKRDAADGMHAVTPALVARAATLRSLPVWPVPILTSVVAIACGIAAEFIYRRSKRDGATFAFVLFAYGVIRLTLDWLLAERSYVFIGLSAAQWIGVIALMTGAAIFVGNARSVKLNSE